MRLHLSAEILAIVDAEAEAMQLDAARFFRMLVRRRMGLQSVGRSASAQRPDGLDVAKPRKEPFVVLLPDDLDRFMRTTCNRLGGASPSTIASDLVLQWVGLSPLDADVTIPIESAAPPSRRRRTGSQPTKVQLLSLAESIVELLEMEAAAMGIRHTEFLRNLLRAKMGVATYRRGDGAPTREPLADADHDKKSYRIHLPLDQVALIDELSQRLGGGEKSTIVSHLILDYVGISPLR
jgi:hypothetical protein